MLPSPTRGTFSNRQFWYGPRPLATVGPPAPQHRIIRPTDRGWATAFDDLATAAQALPDFPQWLAEKQAEKPRVPLQRVRRPRVHSGTHIADQKCAELRSIIARSRDYGIEISFDKARKLLEGKGLAGSALDQAFAYVQGIATTRPVTEENLEAAGERFGLTDSERSLVKDIADRFFRAAGRGGKPGGGSLPLIAHATLRRAVRCFSQFGWWRALPKLEKRILIGLYAAVCEFPQTLNPVKFVLAHRNRTWLDGAARIVGVAFVWASMLGIPYVAAVWLAAHTALPAAMGIPLSLAAFAPANMFAHALWNTAVIVVGLLSDKLRNVEHLPPRAFQRRFPSPLATAA